MSYKPMMKQIKCWTVAIILANCSWHFAWAEVQIEERITPGTTFLLSDGTTYDTAERFNVSRQHQIPGNDSDEVWILGAETGTESFLVASARELPSGLDEIQVDPDLTERREILADLKARLELVMDQVDLHEFEHID